MTMMFIKISGRKGTTSNAIAFGRVLLGMPLPVTRGKCTNRQTLITELGPQGQEMKEACR